MGKYVLITLILFSSLGVRAQKEVKFVGADNSAIDYMGRFDFSNPKAVRFDWPGVTIKCAFISKKVGVKIKGGDRNYYNVFLDGLLNKVIHCKGDTLAWIASQLKRGTHTISLQKRTEAGMGTGVFYGVVLSVKGEVKQLPKSTDRRICFFGNSITCGYGVEGKNKKTHFHQSTENFDKSYAAVLSRAFNAQYQAIAHSGLGVVRNYGDSSKVSTRILPLPARITRVLDNTVNFQWDMTKWVPQVVIINLGTNDFSTKPYPLKDEFQNGYVNMIGAIRKYYGDVPVFCVVGPMIDQPCYSYVKEVVDQCRIKYSTSKVYFIGMPIELLNTSDDLGSDYHPSWKGQRKMAAHMAPIISNVMGWEYKRNEMIGSR